jgi:glycosyltransferase involved in cell wall biosynthesis
LPFGPLEQFLIAEAKELSCRGHDLLIVPRSPYSNVVNQDAQELRDKAIHRRLWSPAILATAAGMALRHPARFLRALQIVARSPRAEVLWKNAVSLPKALWLARQAQRWRADHIHAHWASTMATMAWIASEWSGIPWSFTAHRGDIVGDNLLAAKSRACAFARYISKSGLRMAEERGADVAPGRAVVIHMGVVVPPPRPAAPPAKEIPILLCPANLLQVKGHRYLLEAMRMLRDRGIACQLQIAGQGELRSSLEAMAHRLALEDRVSFRGYVPHNDILDEYRSGSIDIVVLPSVDLGDDLHEGIPVCLMEAMAHGLPVVSTTSGGIPELLHDGAGLLVPPQDSAALADALESLLCNPALRQTRGESGRRRVLDEFSVESVVSELTARLEAALGRDASPLPGSPREILR